MLTRGETYDEGYNAFKWNIPERYNIANDVCDQWADDPGRIALIYEDEQKQVHTYTFGDIRRYANQFANTLLAKGLQRGDRVMLLLAQDPECAIGHVACFKSGIVSSPTSVLFGPDAITYRLNDSNAKAVVTDSANYPKIQAVRDACPNLEHVFVVDGEPDGAENFWTAIADADDTFTNVDTAADDIAWISYTSGTTGMPKGSVQPHRLLLGHMPSLEFIYDFWAPSMVLPFIVWAFCYRRHQAKAVVASMIAGPLSAVVWRFGLDAPMDISSGFFGAGFALVVYLLGCLVLPGPSQTDPAGPIGPTEDQP